MSGYYLTVAARDSARGEVACQQPIVDADGCNICAGSLATRATPKWVFSVGKIRELGR